MTDISKLSPSDALDHFFPSGGADADSDSGSNASTSEVAEETPDAGASSQEQDQQEQGGSEEGNPYKEDGQGASEPEKPATGDDRPLKNLKAEFDRKTARLEQSLRETQEASQRQLESVTAGFQAAIERIGSMFEKVSAKPPAPDPIDELDPDDPDYDIKVLKLELAQTRNDLKAYKQEGETRRTQREQQRQFESHRQTISSLTTRAVEESVKGTPFAENIDAKRMLWDTAYRAIAAVEGDPRRVDEVVQAVNHNRDFLVKLHSKQGQSAAATNSNTGSSRKPIGSRASPPPKVGGQRPKPVAKMDDKEFKEAFSGYLDDKFGKVS